MMRKIPTNFTSVVLGLVTVVLFAIAWWENGRAKEAMQNAYEQEALATEYKKEADENKELIKRRTQEAEKILELLAETQSKLKECEGQR